MAKFIKYENIDFRINNDVFYSNSVAISLQSNISPILLSDGTLLRYAPDNTVIGSLSTEFYLTDSFPNYLNTLSTTESSVIAEFAGIKIENCYLKSLSFKVANFEPVLLSAEFDWYGKINSANSTTALKPFTSTRNSSLTNISHSHHTFLMDIDKVFGYDEITTVTKGGRTSYEYKLKGFLDANFKVEYRYNKRLSAWVQLNNAFGLKYQRWGGYPVQQVMATLGATYAF